MSGTVARSNVVPMPSNGAPPTTPVPWPQPGVWPMPQGMAGCCPPSNLMQCYCDIQNATAFICAVMVDCINTNPAVATAIIDAITKSGSNLPLLGVTNGADAQPGQVGEWVLYNVQVPYTTAALNTIVSLGALPAGDWDCWAYANLNSVTTGVVIFMEPQPPTGFTIVPGSWGATSFDAGAPEAATIVLSAVRALITAPALITANVQVNQPGPGPSAGTLFLTFSARRRR